MAAGEIGSNPYDSMNGADKAEAMLESMVYLGIDFEEAAEALSGAVSSYVKSGLGDYSDNMMENLGVVVQNGINMASNVEGANTSILETDYESSEEVREGLEALDISINF